MIRIGYKGRNKVNNMVREKFEKPEMEMVTFDAEDIIVTSGCLSVGSQKVPDQCGMQNQN